MGFCDWRTKEVINEPTCHRLGYPKDLEFVPATGQITHLIVPGPSRLCGLFPSHQEYRIDFRCILKVGCDMILVNVDEEKALRKC